ncbi:MAG: outer membrane protein transport protein [Myxococcota bacterium]
MTKTVGFAVLASILFTTGVAHAGGYDTPMLYTARHMGMGGTAIANVNDGSALFHNPAGLGNIQRANIIGNFSLLLGNIQSAPAAPGENVESNLTVAPFPLLGGGVRLHEWVTLGLAVYPVASAGATYEYPNSAGVPIEDSTSLLFIEASPGVALSVPESVGIGKLNIGVGYRVTFVSLDRQQLQEGLSPQRIDFSMTGFNFASFRAGIQWQPIPELQLGFVYRHKTVTEITNDDGQMGTSDGVAFLMEFDDISSEFTLPAKLGFGVRGNYERLGVAVDLEYTLNSQNERSVLQGTPVAGGAEAAVANVFRWEDAVTLRLGGEYDIPLGASQEENLITPRLGFVFDAQTGNPRFPTAFGTPPGPTYVFTGGVGYDGGPWEVNVAYAYRRGSAEVTREDISEGNAIEACLFCSQRGDYEIELHGIYADFSYDFE